MDRKRLIVTGLQAGGALVVLVVIILWMSGFFIAKIEPGAAEVRAETAPPDAPTGRVEEATMPVFEEAAGTVQSARKTMVSSRIVGTIRDVTVRAGDTVEKGQVLVVLDERELAAKAQEARRAVQAASASQSKAASDFERAKRLRADGVISRSEFDDAQAAFAVADAELQRARQAQEAADVALSYTRILSPVPGRVVDRLADPGDTALPGEPLLAVYDPLALRIEAPVRESLAVELKVGQPLQVRLDASRASLEGTIDEIVPQAESGSRTLLVKVGLPAAPGLYAGMFGRLRIPAGERKRVTVPQAAVARIGQLAFVNVVDAERRVSRRLVTLGRPAGQGRVEVLSGLRGGDEVLLGNPHGAAS